MSRAARPPGTGRSLVAAARDAVWRPLVAGGVVAALVFALGMTSASATVVGLAVATFAAVVQRVDTRPEPRVTRRPPVARDGVRGDVHDLAWSMVGRDGRTGERAMRRLREAGTRRIARHGLDLADPGHADAVRALLGARAHATLTHRSHPLPSVGDLVHTLGVLEGLGATRARDAAVHDPAAGPAGPTHRTPAAADPTPADPTPAETPRTTR